MDPIACMAWWLRLDSGSQMASIEDECGGHHCEPFRDRNTKKRVFVAMKMPFTPKASPAVKTRNVRGQVSGTRCELSFRGCACQRRLLHQEQSEEGLSSWVPRELACGVRVTARCGARTAMLKRLQNGGLVRRAANGATLNGISH
jgi:hypothetical protein